MKKTVRQMNDEAMKVVYDEVKANAKNSEREREAWMTEAFLDEISASFTRGYMKGIAGAVVLEGGQVVTFDKGTFLFANDIDSKVWGGRFQAVKWPAGQFYSVWPMSLSHSGIDSVEMTEEDKRRVKAVVRYLKRKGA